MGVQMRLSRGYKREAIAILRSQGTQDVLADRAEKIKKAAGEGFETGPRMRKDRASNSVITATFRARYAEAKYQRLSRSIDAAR